MQIHDVRIKWAPRHIRIEGNEAADKLVDLGAMKED
jgi:ribonuclease HI